MSEASPGLGARLQFFAICAALHLLAFVEFTRLHPESSKIENWREQFTVLIVLSFLLCLRICLRRDGRGAVYFLVPQIFFLLLMNYPERSNVTLASLLFAIPLFEFALLGLNALFPSLFLPFLAICSAAVHPVPFWNEPYPDPNPRDLLFLGCSVALASFVAFRLRRLMARVADQDSSLNRQSVSIDNLLNANLDFQTYAAEIGEKSTIEERKRLTREVHDIVGYTLINLRMMMEAAIELASPESERLRSQLVTARDQVMSGLLETRRALRNFRAMESVVPEGANRIQRFVKSFSQATGIVVTVNYGNIPRTFGPEIDAAVVRVIQESMTNAFRHGKATEIQISLWVDDGRLILKISDNGVGAVDIKPGIGLSGMGERIESLHGTLSVRGVEHGFVVDATVPLRKENDG